MKKPNAYLQQRDMKMQKALDVGMDTGFQKCWDLMQLVLRNPEVMGKDTFGQGRIKRLHAGLMKYEREYGKAWLADVESDVLQRDLDAALGEIWKDELCPFPERYPYVLMPGYDKGRKNWR